MGLMGRQYSGEPDPKILSLPLRESHVLSAGTLLWFPALKRKSRTCALGTASAGQGGTADRPSRSACLPLHHGGSRMRARALEGVPAVPQ